MFDFSGDETLCTFAAIAISAVGLFRWYGPLVVVPTLGRSGGRRVMLGLFPPMVIFITLPELMMWADAQVARHADYILLFLLVQSAWMTLGSEVLRMLGISVRDDAIDRNNPAAAVAGCGFLAGLAIVFALSNVGGGPTIWTTIVPAFASSVALIALWLIIESIGGGVADAITIDRDAASANRIAGAMIGCGIVLGRAAGGNWISWAQTFRDLAIFGWPAILMAIAAAAFQRLWKPTIAHPRPDEMTMGVFPAIIFVISAISIIAFTSHGFNPAKW